MTLDQSSLMSVQSKVGGRNSTSSSRSEAWLKNGGSTSELLRSGTPSVVGESELVDSAYEEYCQRRAEGEDPDIEAFCERFPQVKPALLRLLHAHQYLEENPHLIGELATPNWPKPGQEFLGFQLQKELGRGAFARVFLATEPALGDRAVALKVSQSGLAEAHTLGRISHPNIVPVFSVDEESGSGLTAVCMPYLGSATLCNLLEMVAGKMPPTKGEIILEAAQDRGRPAKGPAPGIAGSAFQTCSYIDGVRSIGRQLAEALHFIHQRKICHLDLKPSNVLLTPDGTPMILDFNLSKDAQAATVRLGGTLPYMSPEQLTAMGQAQDAAPGLVDSRSDLYSLGVILYELLAGRHPFGPLAPKMAPEDAQRFLLSRQRQGPEPLRRLNRDIEPKLAQIVERCLAYNADDRPESAADLATKLRRKPSAWARLTRYGRLHPWMIAASVIFTLVIGGAATALWPNQESMPAREWRLSQEALQNRNYRQGVEHLNLLLGADPDNIDALRARAGAYKRLGDSDAKFFDLAAADYQRLSNVLPDSDSEACAGYCLLRRQLYKVAAKYFTAAIKRGGASAETYNDLAYCLLRNNELAEAEENLNASLSSKKLQAAYHNRGLLRLRQLSKGFDWRALTGKSPKDAELRAAKEWETLLVQAKSDMSFALGAGPDHVELYHDAARVFAIASVLFPDDGDRAVRYLAAAIDLGYDPNALALEESFAPLRPRQDFKQLLAGPANPLAMPPTRRIVDPGRD